MMKKILCPLLLAMSLLSPLGAEDIPLPKAVTTGGMSLNDALSRRKSTRDFSPRELTLQQISNLCWAANGINRPDGGHTAPTALNAREISLYILLKSGAYLYDAEAQTLRQISTEDLRPLTRSKNAPVEILLVSDLTKQGRTYSETDAGFVSQNIYLHCAASGLGTVVRSALDNALLQKKLNLPDSRSILYAQSAGYPQQKE